MRFVATLLVAFAFGVGCAPRVASPQQAAQPSALSGPACAEVRFPEPTPIPDQALLSLLEKQAKVDCPSYIENDWGERGLVSPCAVVRPALQASPSAEAATDALAAQYGLSRQASALMLRGLLRQSARQNAKHQQAFFFDFLAAARLAPGNKAALTAAILARPFHSNEADRALVAVLASSPEPAATALSLLEGADLFESQLTAFVLEREPGSWPKLLDRFGLENGYTDRAPVYLAFLGRALAAPEQLGTDRLGLLADRTVRTLLARSPNLAVEVLRGLPPDVRRAILQSEIPTVNSARVAGKTRSEPAPDVRPDLALALVLAGDRDTARALLPAACAGKPAADMDGRQRRWERERKTKCRILEAAFGNEADVFDLVVELETERGNAWASPVLFDLLSKDYPDALRSKLEWLSHEENIRGPESCGTGIRVLDEQVERINADISRESQRAARLLAALPKKDEQTSFAPTPAWLSRQLQAPPSFFEEHDLPEGIAPYRKEDAPKDDVKGEAPRGFWPVRIEEAGGQRFLIALSHNLDPTGELSGGGFWLFQSTEEGAWGSPLYLGLRQFHPYTLVKASRLPVLDGAKLRLEAQLRELDEASITFPPVGLKAKREKSGLLLEASLEAIRRDTDGDGLSDLVEARLLTNPESADTDGDGLGDAEDRLPQIAPGPPQAQSAIISAFLDALGLSRGKPALITGLPAEGDDPVRLPTAREPADETRALYFIGDRTTFASVETGTRLIVLSPKEYEQARQAFGVFYPLEIESMVFAPDGQRVFLEWSESWRGGAIVGTKKDGKWVMKMVKSWIT